MVQKPKGCVLSYTSLRFYFFRRFSDWIRMKTNILKQIGLFLSKNSSTILTVFSVVGVVGTAVTTAKCTPEAVSKVNIAALEKNSEEDLTPVEIIKAGWKSYIPAYLAGAGTIACVIGAHVADRKRVAAISSAYALTEAAFSKYRDKTKEIIGEKKEKHIRDEVAAETAIETDKPETIIVCGGDTLCYDTVSGRYFKSNMDKLKKIENKVNKDLFSSMWISLNDVYYEMGLPPISIGDDIGWTVDSDKMIEFNFSTFLAESDEPCITVNFEVEPKWSIGRFAM